MRIARTFGWMLVVALLASCAGMQSTVVTRTESGMPNES